MSTFVAKPADALADRKWWVVDAKGKPLGRLASQIAAILRGKHKPIYTPHVDTGDFVIVVNASEIGVSGRKRTDKLYFHHTKYPGGMKSEAFDKVSDRKPGFPIEKAVKGMLPKSTLGRAMLDKLKIYGGADHPHQAQKPEPLALSL